ncbi:MAG: hypothetical protein J7L95_01940 [Prolixibacteraceae bacterium]|nr:hypothetical protein [Prolixibacteraceae bacterium]
MNIEWLSKTSKRYFQWFFTVLVIFLLPVSLLAQKNDSIVPLQQPKKILRKIDIRKLTQNGFNF